MKKFSAFLRSMVSITTVLVLVFILTGSANAASTIGTNMLTTGTFTQTVGSATAAQFQNAAGTINTLTVDTTNNRVGVNTTTPQTKFEVQGTASASYFITGNTLQVGGFATAAYSRFGTSTSGRLKNANDLLVSGQFEVAGSAQFVTASISGAFDVGGTASISGVLTLGNGQIRPQDNSATAFRFQNAAGTTTVMTINTTLGRVGIGATPQTVFEVQGTASASYLLTGNTLQVGGFATAAYSRFGTSTSTRLVGANDLLVSGQFGVAGSAQFVTASTSGAFESIGRASASTMFVTSSFVAGHNVASSAAEYVAEFGGRETATVSILFGSSAAGSATGAGTCLQMKNTAGTWVYLRINGTSSLSLDIDTTKCH